MPQAGDAFAQDGGLASEGIAAAVEQQHLAGHRVLDLGHVLVGQQFLRESDACLTRAFGVQARFARRADDELRPGRGVLRLGHFGVESDERLTGAHEFAFAHQDGLDHAAGEMLHGFAVAFGDDRAGCGHAFVQRRQTCPEQEAAESDGQRPEAETHGGPVIVVRRGDGVDGLRAAFGGGRGASG